MAEKPPFLGFLRRNPAKDAVTIGKTTVSLKNFIHRYRDIDRWRNRVPAIVNDLSDQQSRKSFVEKTSPRDQYKILELVAKFGQENDAAIKAPGRFDPSTEELTGRIFGEMMVFNLNKDNVEETLRINGLQLDEVGRTEEFINKGTTSGMPVISNKSKMIGLTMFFESMGSEYSELHPEVKDFLILMVSRTKTDEVKDSDPMIYQGFFDLVPDDIFEELTSLARQRKETEERLEGMNQAYIASIEEAANRKKEAEV